MFIMFQADLEFKKKEMEKSEATTQALEDGKIRYYISWSTNVTWTILPLFTENMKLQMDLVKVEEVCCKWHNVLY